MDRLVSVSKFKPGTKIGQQNGHVFAPHEAKEVKRRICFLLMGDFRANCHKLVVVF